MYVGVYSVYVGVYSVYVGVYSVACQVYVGVQCVCRGIQCVCRGYTVWLARCYGRAFDVAVIWALPPSGSMVELLMRLSYGHMGLAPRRFYMR